MAAVQLTVFVVLFAFCILCIIVFFILLLKSCSIQVVRGGGSCFDFPVYAGVYLCLFVYQKYFLLHIAPARWYVVVAVCLLFFCVFLYSCILYFVLPELL